MPIAARFIPYLWGIETYLFLIIIWSRIWFIPYLWGIETALPSSSHARTPLFIPYLWGIETEDEMHSTYTNNVFIPYLWGIETSPPLSLRDPRLPGLFRTYEELKRLPLMSCPFLTSKFIPYLWGIETTHLTNSELIEQLFIPYLWGIETHPKQKLFNVLKLCLFRTYEELKLLYCPWWSLCRQVYSVPMRNWNK